MIEKGIDEKMEALFRGLVALRSAMEKQRREHETDLLRFNKRIREMERMLKIKESPVRYDDMPEYHERSSWDDATDYIHIGRMLGSTSAKTPGPEYGTDDLGDDAAGEQDAPAEPKRKRGRPRKVRP